VRQLSLSVPSLRHLLLGKQETHAALISFESPIRREEIWGSRGVLEKCRFNAGGVCVEYCWCRSQEVDSSVRDSCCTMTSNTPHHPELAGVHLGLTEEDIEAAENTMTSNTPHHPELARVHLGLTEEDIEAGENTMTSNTPHHPELAGVHLGLTEEDIEAAENTMTSNTPHNPELAGVHLGLTEEDIEAGENIDLREADDALLPYYEVKSLLWIKRNTVFSTALEDWDRKVKLLSDWVDKKEKRSSDLKDEIYRLAGVFSVFQGVVLTAVTQLTNSGDKDQNCQRVWSPVILSALVWVVAIVGVWQKLARIQVIDAECAEVDQARRVPISHHPMPVPASSR
jgi:hypothetical protein